MLVCLSWCDEKAQVRVHLPFQLCSSITALEMSLQGQRCGILFSFQWIFSYFSWAPLVVGRHRGRDPQIPSGLQSSSLPRCLLTACQV